MLIVPLVTESNVMTYNPFLETVTPKIVKSKWSLVLKLLAIGIGRRATFKMSGNGKMAYIF